MKFEFVKFEFVENEWPLNVTKEPLTLIFLSLDELDRNLESSLLYLFSLFELDLTNA